MKLTQKNRAFVDAYLDQTNPETYGNAAKSALKAGYRAKNIYSVACELLKKVNISGEIAQRQQELKAAQKKTKQGLLDELYGMLHEATDKRLRLSIMDRIILIEGYEAPKKTENKNENMNINLDAVIDQAAEAMRKELQTYSSN